MSSYNTRVMSVSQLRISKPNALTLRKAASVDIRQISRDNVSPAKLKITNDCVDSIMNNEKWKWNCHPLWNVWLNWLTTDKIPAQVSVEALRSNKSFGGAMIHHPVLHNLHLLTFADKLEIMASAMAAASGLSEEVLERLAGDPLSCVERVARWAGFWQAFSVAWGCLNWIDPTTSLAQDSPHCTVS